MSNNLTLKYKLQVEGHSVHEQKLYEEFSITGSTFGWGCHRGCEEAAAEEMAEYLEKCRGFKDSVNWTVTHKNKLIASGTWISEDCEAKWEVESNIQPAMVEHFKEQYKIAMKKQKEDMVEKSLRTIELVRTVKDDGTIRYEAFNTYNHCDPVDSIEFKSGEESSNIHSGLGEMIENIHANRDNNHEAGRRKKERKT